MGGDEIMHEQGEMEQDLIAETREEATVTHMPAQIGQQVRRAVAKFRSLPRTSQAATIAARAAAVIATARSAGPASVAYVHESDKRLAEALASTLTPAEHAAIRARKVDSRRRTARGVPGSRGGRADRDADRRHAMAKARASGELAVERDEDA